MNKVKLVFGLAVLAWVLSVLLLTGVAMGLIWLSGTEAERHTSRSAPE